MKLLIIAALLTITSGSYFDATPQDKAVTVKVAEEKVVPGTQIKVKFIELLEDARCPADVNCVWAGNAKIKLHFSKGSDDEIAELNTGVKPQTFEFGGYSFKITRLIPHPRTNVRINRLGYEATLTAKKL
jgi:hypothetical protein